MLYESSWLRVRTEDGIATIWLTGTSEPELTWGLATVQQLDLALDRITKTPGIEIIVIRSGLPTGFCAGWNPHALASLQTDQDVAHFSMTGQKVLWKLNQLTIPSVALIEGPCLGPGLELALACQVTLSVSGPENWFGFTNLQQREPIGWGGTVWLSQRIRSHRAHAILDGQLLTGRELYELGVIDDCFSQRRARVELQTRLDSLRENPSPRILKYHRTASMKSKLASERISFRRQMQSWKLTPFVPWWHAINSIPPSVTLSGPGMAHLAVELAIRGSKVKHDHATTNDEIADAFRSVLSRGRITSLELQEAKNRIHSIDSNPGNRTTDFVMSSVEVHTLCKTINKLPIASDQAGYLGSNELTVPLWLRRIAATMTSQSTRHHSSLHSQSA